MGKRGLILASLQVLLTSLTATAGPSEVAVPAFSFMGRAPSSVLEVPAFYFVGRAFVPGVDVPAFAFVGRMPAPVVDVPAFSFAGRGGTSLVVAGKDKTLPTFALAPVTRTTPSLVMTGRRPQNTNVNTRALTMTGRRPQDLSVTTGKLQMTGRRASFGESAGFGQTRPGGDSPAQDGSRRGKPVFRLLRVVPLGATGTNPFDFRDVRTDVAVALAGGSIAPTPGGGSGGLTPPTPVVPTALTLLGGLPAFEVKAGVPALIQVDTAAQTLSALYNGAPQAVTPSTALTLSLDLIAFGNVTARVDAVAPWSVVSRDYPQPFDTSRTTCTVLRHTDGTHYKILLGVTEGNTGYLMNSLSGTHHDTTAPSCP
jgi:hypothetical protein